MVDKMEIRREVRRRIKELSAEQCHNAAERIYTEIVSKEQFHRAHCIALFVAMKDEVPTKMVLDAWQQLGKRIVIPRVEGDIMRFYDYSADRMVTGAFGIEEPVGEEEVMAEEIDLIIVPARAFTLSGIRLGRGGGFYDKYMSQPSFRAYKIGIAYKEQIFETLPYDTHEIMVDEVVVG